MLLLDLGPVFLRPVLFFGSLIYLFNILTVAAVKSVEDHGYTLHTGIAGLTTFLKFGNAAKHIELKNEGRPLGTMC